MKMNEFPTKFYFKVTAIEKAIMLLFTSATNCPNKIKDCEGMPAPIMVIHISIFITFQAGEDYRFSSVII